MTSRSWQVREYRESDISELLTLGKRCFPEAEEGRFDYSFWRWEFLNNAAGPARLWVAAEPDGKLVGHYAIIPTRWSIDRHEVLGSIVVHVMTDPDYRKQGIFVELGKTALAAAGLEGIKFSYGFPVRPEVMPGHLKVGWEKVFSIPVWVRPLRSERLVQHYIPYKPLQVAAKTLLDPAIALVFRKHRRPSHANISLEKIRQFDERVEYIWEAVRRNCRVIQVRDKRFLNWRYFENPFRCYEVYTAERQKQLIGYIVLRRLRIFEFECLAIVDLLVQPGETEALDLLIENAVYEGSRENAVDLVACMMNVGNPFEKRLRQHRFMNSRREFWFIRRFNADLKLSAVMRDSRYFLTWGDTDVV